MKHRTALIAGLLQVCSFVPCSTALATSVSPTMPAVGDCGDIVSARNLPEPWEQATASYANGDVRLAIIDTREPAAAAVHVMVLSPPRNEIGDRQCKLVSLMRSDGGAPFGFFNADLTERSASIDPQNGLVVTVPIQLFVPETGDGDPAALTVTINQSSGQITAEVSK